MPAATASGADAGANGSAQRREHNQGNQGRTYTVEQKAAVIRIRRCQHTAFYEILGIEKTASDGEIKKAYRKLSLLTHPDKNGHEHADEAFKSALLPCLSLDNADGTYSGLESVPDPLRPGKENKIRQVRRGS